MEVSSSCSLKHDLLFWISRKFVNVDPRIWTGFTGGYKTSSGSPAGLIARSQDDGQEGIIYVAMNYRLGLFVGMLRPVQRLVLTCVRVGYRGQHSKQVGVQMLGCSTKDSRLNG